MSLQEREDVLNGLADRRTEVLGADLANVVISEGGIAVSIEGRSVLSVKAGSVQVSTWQRGRG